VQEILYWQSSTVQMMYTIVADAIKAKGELPLMPSNPPPRGAQLQSIKLYLDSKFSQRFPSLVRNEMLTRCIIII